MAAIKRALISVSDKTDVVDFARLLKKIGVEILSTGGTASLLAENDIEVTEVSDYTGFPEMMDGRVKTLHPKIHGGLLGRRGTDDEVMVKHDIKPIDMVVVNLYPFTQTIARKDCTLPLAIENIDIGGPTMLRSAAKNHQSVTVIVDAADYKRVLIDMKKNKGAVSDALRFDLATKAFEHTARYDGAIANYLGAITSKGKTTTFPRTFSSQYRKVQEMRYGENPHQDAAFYVETKDADSNNRSTIDEATISTAKQLQGKELSYNNIADTDAALECVKQFEGAAACVIVKHANPCGVATGDNLLQAYQRAYSTDPESAFGGIIAFNQKLGPETVSAILKQQFVEVIIAPSVSQSVVDVLAAKKNVRLLVCGHWPTESESRYDFKRVNGGLLVQNADLLLHNDLMVATKRKPTKQEKRDLLFAWKVAKFVKSNAIVYARDNMTIGVGAGQMSRINSARIAEIKAKQAKLKVRGSVMASDAFFPFRDGIDAAAKAGIKAVIQPGGSMNDEEVINAANKHKMAMVFTGMRHFRH